MAGPNSILVNVRRRIFFFAFSSHFNFFWKQTLLDVDAFTNDLHTSLEDRNLTDIVDIVFVSDHGMTDTSNPELVFMDDILGDGVSKVVHVDGDFRNQFVER